MAFEAGAQVFDQIAPHPAGVDADDELIHERAYVVRAYRKGLDLLVLRGAVRDQKPPGLYIPEDPEPLTVHHMVVDLHVAIPSLEIVEANVVFETHPHAGCPRIADHYEKLVGLSIARGFTHKVRDLFGGPRGCTHTTALLQAMAPVAIQSLLSFRVAKSNEGIFSGAMSTPEARQDVMAMNVNTCHIWAEDGDQVQAIRNGDPMEAPVWITKRFEKLGLDPEHWRRGS
jgi:hypothetical protein